LFRELLSLRHGDRLLFIIQVRLFILVAVNGHRRRRDLGNHVRETLPLKRGLDGLILLCSLLRRVVTVALLLLRHVGVLLLTDGLEVLIAQMSVEVHLGLAFARLECRTRFFAWFLGLYAAFACGAGAKPTARGADPAVDALDAAQDAAVAAAETWEAKLLATAVMTAWVDVSVHAEDDLVQGFVVLTLVTTVVEVGD
jgi:hypothetical protein